MSRPVCSLWDHTNDVTSVDFAGKSLLATGSSDKSVRLYKWLPGNKFEEVSHSPLKRHRYGVNCVCFSPFGTKLASSSTDGKTIVWDVKTGSALCVLQTSAEPLGVRSCCFSPNSAFLVTGGEDDKASLWDVSTLGLLGQYDNQESTVCCVAFTPDSLFFATGSANGEIRLWDAAYGHSQPMAIRQEAHDLGVAAMDFNPAACKNTRLGQHYLLVTGGHDCDLQLWSVQLSSHGAKSGASIALHHTLCGHLDPITCVRFSRDGQKICSASGDKSVRIWDATQYQALGILHGHGRYVTSCAFSEDGKLVAAGGGDRHTHIWVLEHLGTKGCDQQKLPKVFARKVPGMRMRENKRFVNWSEDDLCEWLSEHNMAEYAHNFRSNAMTGRELLEVDDHILEHKLGIEAYGHRSQLLRLIARARRETAGGGHRLSICTSVPEEFICPITQEVMVDPVLCADGFTYERDALEAWLESGKMTSPMTNETLSHQMITPNRTLRNLIIKFNEEAV